MLFLSMALMFSGCMTALKGRGSDADAYGSGDSRKVLADDAFRSTSRESQDRERGIYGSGDARSKDTDPSSSERAPRQGSDTYGTGNERKASQNDAFSPPRRPGQTEQNDAYGTGEQRGRAGDGTSNGSKERYENGGVYSLMRGHKTAAEEMVVINRPPSIQGLTGLLITTSAFTRKAGSLAFGVSLMAEDNQTPDYRVVQTPLTLTWGLSKSVEIGMKGKAVMTENVNGIGRERGAGDSEILIKWRFIDQTETFPAVAVGVGGMLPTGNEDKGLNEVVHWGARVLALVSSEARILDDSFLGLYLEAQAVFIDEFVKGGTTPGAERYGQINVGMLFPLTSEGRLQAVVEYNQLLHKSNLRPTLNERNFNAFLPAIRYVTDRLNVSLGAQYVNKEQTGLESTYRFIGSVSYAF